MNPEDLIKQSEAYELSLRAFAKTIQFGGAGFREVVNALCAVTVLRMILENGTYAVQTNKQQLELTIN